MRTEAIAFLLLLGGCASLPSEEYIWQTAHAVDIAQTIDIANGGHCQEQGLGTRQMIGQNPGIAGAIGWGVATAGLHAYITHELEVRDAPRWIRWVWQITTVSLTINTVVSNRRLSEDC